MEILINQPYYLNEKGKRENNEDSIFPAPGKATAHDKLFIVCDGVGGAEKGEVASKLACESMADYFLKNDFDKNENDLLKAFDFTQKQFDNFFIKEPAAKGMGTTLVLMHIHNQGISVVHCGDSRLYHFRKDRIIWQTLDHTVVNELVRQGVISAEEAASRPKSNRISRAIQGYSVHRSKPDIHFINEIEPGDLFFLCSDGIYEVISNTELTDILSSNHSLKEKIEIIHTICETNSRDNYSAYLIQVEHVKTENEKDESFLKSLKIFRKHTSK